MDAIIRTDEGYKVRIYDNGYVFLCELIDNKWQDCVFETQEEAQIALDNYHKSYRNFIRERGLI